MIWQACVSIVAVGMMAVASWSAGAPMVRRIPVLASDSAGRALWALAVGSILWAFGLTALGLLGLLYMPLIAGLTWAACLAGAYQLLQELEELSSGRFSPNSPLRLHSLPKPRRPVHPPAESGKWVPAWPGPGHWAAGGSAKPSGSSHSPVGQISLPAYQPLPYEHAPPPDLVGPGGVPFWKLPQQAQFVPVSEQAGAWGALPRDWEPLSEEPEIPGGQQLPASDSANPAASTGPAWRVDPPGRGLFGQQQRLAVPSPPGWLCYCLWSLAAGGVLTSLLLALAPPTELEALSYHLELPKRWLQNNRLALLPYPELGRPCLVHLWFLWALALDGETAAHLVHWQWGLLLGWAAWYVARIFLDRGWAWMAGALVLLAPGVLYQMTVSVGDLAGATFCTLSLAACWKACCQSGKADGLSGQSPSLKSTTRQKGPSPQSQWFLLAGLAFGGAAAIHPAALLMAPVLLGLGAVLARQAVLQRRFVQGAICGGSLALALLTAWYFWPIWQQGHSVVVLTDGFSPGSMSPSETSPPDDATTVSTGRLLAWLAIPWNLTMHPERFGGKQYAVGAVWLAVLPGLLWTQRRRSLELLVALAGGYLLLWALWRPQLRLLLPMLPMLAPAAVWIWSQMGRLPRLARCMAAGGIAVCLVAPVGWLGRQLPEHLPVALGLESRQEFLYRSEPSYPAAALVNLLLGPEAKILTQELKTFYFDSAMVPESLYRRQTQYDQKIQQPGDLARLLRQDGFTHLLLVETLPDGGSGENPPGRVVPEHVLRQPVGATHSAPKMGNTLSEQNPQENSADRKPLELAPEGIKSSSVTLTHLVEAELRLPQSGLQELSQYRVTDRQGTVRRYRLIAIR